MARASPLLSAIENVRIVHAEDNLEEVVRELAKGLEHHLKLPGQADYDRQKPQNPEHVNKQLEIAVTLGNPTLFFITDSMLLLYKKKKKQAEALKNLLKKDGDRDTGRIAILWGPIKNKELEKKILGDLKGQLKGIKSENFSLTELGNVVEAAYKIWQGPDAVLPSKAMFSEMKESLAEDSIEIEESMPEKGAMDKETSPQLPPPELTMVYYGFPQMKFISDLSFGLMVYLKLSTSPQFYNFSNMAGPSDVFEKILKQLRGVVAGHYKAVLLLSSDLIKLLCRVQDAKEFEMLCDRATYSGSCSIVFLLHDTTLEDVRSYSPHLAEIIEKRHHTYERNYSIDSAAYELSRHLQDGEILEAEENDENTMYRSTRMDFNHHRDQMISSGEDVNIPRVASSKSKVVSASGESIPRLDHPKSQSDKLTSSDCPLTCTEVENNDVTRNTGSSATNGSQGKDNWGAVSPVEGKEKSNLDVSMVYEQTNQQNRLPMHDSPPAKQEDPSNLKQPSMTSTTDERDKPHSLISKSSSSSLAEGSSQVANESKQKEGSQQNRRLLQSQEPPSVGQTGPQGLTGHPPSRLGAFAQSPDTSQHVPSGQPMAMNYMPHQPNGAVRSNPGAEVNQQVTTRSDPMHFFKSNPEAAYHLKLLLKSQSSAAAVDPRAVPSVPYGFLQHPQSANHNQVHPASTQSHFQAAQRYAPQQQLTATNVVDYPASAYSQQQAYGPQHMHTSTGMPPVQPASAKGFPPGAGGHPHLMHSRSVPEMHHHLPNLPVLAGQNIRLLKLPADVKHKIEQKLNIKRVAGMYWRHFAEEIGVDSDEIGVWDSQNSCNYMEKLFGWIGTHREGYTVYDFRLLADRFKRPDVVKILDTWMATQAQTHYPSRT